MTREDIFAKWSAMSPRERDAWVAEAVFGWKTYGKFYQPDGVRVLIPFYTTDVAAAITVLGAVPGEFILFRVSLDKFVASFGYSTDSCPECGEEPFEVEAQGIAESPAEAICLAAIIAKLTKEVGE
ncbi:hypothetical protein P4H42_03840 [Paenibacillus macerans]|uniref:BC1872 family protein n=1 Tax=Paenibacillus macerans TaxID=44252 RepID=UPI002DB958B1|nr:hypothetical protein [Paenibacillus macerans]MEC0328755.1 hypothetical protein [Paenibacillus macerans]